MKSKLWLVTVIMIAALVLSACGTPALSGTLSAAPALNQAPANTAPTTGRSAAALGSVSIRFVWETALGLAPASMARVHTRCHAAIAAAAS